MSQLNIHIWLFCEKAHRNIAGVPSPVHCALLCSPGQVTPLCSLSDDVSIHNCITTPDIVTQQYAGHGLTFESGSLQFYYLAVMISIQSARCAGPQQGNI